MPLLRVLVIALLSAPLALAADESRKLPPPADREIDFVKDVQPIFRKTCYSCHGAEEQEAGLRLDIKARALEGGDGGKSIVPGKSAESRLLVLVAGLDEDAGLMPPDGEGTPLTKKQIAVLRAWIDQGATWPDDADVVASNEHWSFQPIERPATPTVSQPEWVLNAIDTFILARLDRESIAPAPAADRATLMRRLYLDLLGVPPRPDEVDAFLGDDQPGAYERLVERVFASPHYGERWGRHWLDLARYADSDGYEKDRARPHAWRYRNWVIESLNADMPFDQFSIQQLAGDMLSDADIEQRVASGFHRNTLHNTEGGTDKEEDRVKKTVDRTNTTGAIWLGLTVGCAQCHSHKYDPLTQREYYSLYSFFNSINEVDIDAPTQVAAETYQLAKAAFDREHRVLEEQVTAYSNSDRSATQAKWEETAAKTAVAWSPLKPLSVTSKHGAELVKQDDQSWLAKGKNQVSDVYSVEAKVAGPVTAIRLEVLPDDSLVKKGPGRADNGNFVLTTFSVSATASGGGEAKPIVLHNAKADHSQNDWEVAKAINDSRDDGWAVSPHFGKRHVAVFEFKEPTSAEGDVKLQIVLDQNYTRGTSHNIGRFRLSVTSGSTPVSLEGMPAEVVAALAVTADQRSAEQQKHVTAYFNEVDPELARLKQAVANHAKKAPKSSGIKAQTVAQIAQPRETRVHIRGDFLNKGDLVTTRAPSVLPPVEPRGEQPDRLDFANWLFDPTNPLTARVTVNRVWQRIFGRGLVATVDDFGTQGDPPTHPQLLDWLASEFQQQQYSLKALQRVIVTSNTYRQSSAFRPELVELDPDNSLLARQARRRVESEVIRDLALAACQLLDNRIGGPSVRPAQPTEYAALTYANSAKWAVSGGGDAYRRGLYTFFQRTSPYPMLMTFDSPDSNIVCTQRSMSNTPLQALTLWNDPVFFECAQAFARHVVSHGPSPIQDRARYAFQLCLSRPPELVELDAVVDLYEQQSAAFKADEKMTAAINGKRPLGEGVAAEEVAAWTIVGRTLMNLDEFITRE